MLLACPAIADSANMVEIRPGQPLSLDTGPGFDLAEEGAIEFWYRHLSSQREFDAFTNRTFQQDAYAVVMTIGEGDDFTCAVVIGPGSKGQASVGVINDPAVLADQRMLAEVMSKKSVPLRTIDDFGDRDPAVLVSLKTYHFLLAKPKGRDEIVVFFEGYKQQAIPDANFGKTVGNPLVLGFDPSVIKLKGKNEKPNTFPFSGLIGGLRLWETGDFPSDKAASRLKDFGRSADTIDITRIPGYGRLHAFGDFEGKRWDADREAWATDAPPLLRTADPFAGAWKAQGATALPTKKESSVFVDYPVYTFTPATAKRLSDGDPRRSYNVFEDANYIGQLKLVKHGESEEWLFDHVDEAWKPQTVLFRQAGKEYVLDWLLTEVPTNYAIAGATRGSLRMVRETVTDLGVKSPSAGRLTALEEQQRANAGDDITLVFLYTAFPKFFDRLYGSYNVVDMDPWNLFDTGVQTNEKVLEPPADSMFELNKSEQLILPYDLGVVQSHLGLESTTSTLVSSASEYNQVAAGRIGGGFSGSFTVGTGSASPVSASATVNLSVVVQSEVLQELSGQRSQTTEKIIRDKWTKKYALYHKKDVMRVSDAFGMALRTLHARCMNATPEGRRELVFDFYDKWGTHYPFAMSFGSLELSETEITDNLLSEASKEDVVFDVAVNDGKTGNTTSNKTSKIDQNKDSNTTVRSFGSEAEPVPISVDLRPLFELLTPQQFPDEPQLYVELRHQLGGLLENYRAYKITGVIDKMPSEQKEAAKQVVTQIQYNHTPIDYQVLGLRYLGVKLEPLFVEGDDYDWDKFKGANFDGSIVFRPGVLQTDEIALPKRLDDLAEEFLKLNPPMTVVDRKGPAEQARFLTLGAVQPFGEAKQTELFIRVPNSELTNYIYVGVDTAFNSTSFPGGYTIKGESLDINQAINAELVRAVKPTHNLGKATLKIQDFITEVNQTRGIALWANPWSVNVDVTKKMQPNRPFFHVNPGTHQFNKTWTGSRDLFLKPQRGKWRRGETTFYTSLMKGNKVVGSLGFTVVYEYALLDNLKQARKSNAKLLPESAWGNFSTGPSSEPINPFANRSTSTARMPSSAPASERLNIDSASAQIYRIEPEHWLPMRPTGWDGLMFSGKGNRDARHWILKNRGIGEWSIIASLNGTALTVKGAGENAKVVMASLRDNDDAQVWVAEQKRKHYYLRNKKTGQYLTFVEGEIVVALAPKPGVFSRLTFTPKLNPLGGTIDPLIRAWQTSVDKLYTPLPEGTNADQLFEEYWQFMLLAADRDFNGLLDAKESATIDLEGEIDYDRFLEVMAEHIQEAKADFAEGTPKEQRKKLSEGWAGIMAGRLDLLSERLVENLDQNDDSYLTAEEALPLFSSPAFDRDQLMQFANDDGELDDSALFRSAVREEEIPIVE